MIQGKAITVPIVKGIIAGEEVKLAFLKVGKIPGASCHFSFCASKKHLTAKEIIIDNKKYEILGTELSKYIPNMWTFHGRESI